ncbi:alpha/beta hydrolase family protein [Kribbella sp. CA-294648]|uniref:alpha/beta hydrolase family protein n=1 Tax=Kribbella sp. CA-294648 TaxID=3239948 RepID=UPI003D8FF6EA
MIWRRIVAAVLATAILTTAVTAVAVPASTVSTPYRVVSLKPTGPYSVGTATVHLTDARRELMVSVWYPTRSPQRQYAGRTRAKPWGRHPVLLYSPGSGGSREDLASQGYVVVAIAKLATDTRTVDVRFVLDALSRLPCRLRQAMDLNRIGMFGVATGPERSIRTSRRPPPDMRSPRFSATF